MIILVFTAHSNAFVPKHLIRHLRNKNGKAVEPPSQR